MLRCATIHLPLSMRPLPSWSFFYFLFVWLSVESDESFIMVVVFCRDKLWFWFNSRELPQAAKSEWSCGKMNLHRHEWGWLSTPSATTEWPEDIGSFLLGLEGFFCDPMTFVSQYAKSESNSLLKMNLPTLAFPVSMHAFWYWCVAVCWIQDWSSSRVVVFVQWSCVIFSLLCARPRLLNVSG